MNDVYRGLLRRAGGLTRRSDPVGATRVIRRALRDALPAGGPLPAHRPMPSGTAPWMDAVRKARDAADRRPDGSGARAARAPRSTPAPAPSASPAGGQVLRGHFDSPRHGGRDWRLYVPTAAARGARLPLVVMLHGCTQGADDFARGTRMDAVAEAADAFVLYPEQSSKANPQRCWNWFKHTHQGIERGEPALIAGLVAEVAATHPIDVARVFAAGLSAGGAMAAILGECAPATFAGVGVHSGLGAGSAHDMPSAFGAMQGQGQAVRAPAVPTIVLHGDADRTVDPVNADRLVEAVVRAAPGALRRVEKVRANGRDCLRERWVAAAASQAPGRRDGEDVLCERWTVGGAGHAWSGGDPAGSYTDASGPDASALMMDFFTACAVPSARAA